MGAVGWYVVVQLWEAEAVDVRWRGAIVQRVDGATVWRCEHHHKVGIRARRCAELEVERRAHHGIG